MNIAVFVRLTDRGIRTVEFLGISEMYIAVFVPLTDGGIRISESFTIRCV